MSQIYAPYSVARQDMLSFKEIDGTLFRQLQSEMFYIKSLDDERQRTNLSKMTEKRRNEWYDYYCKRCSILRSNISGILYKIPEARYFSYLIKDLRIETNGNVCKISGIKDLLFDSKGFIAFDQILINKAITFSR